jgi:phosphoribosylformylglycinamidine synthase
MKAVVVVFPGSNCDRDCLHALRGVLGVETRFVWHKERVLGVADLVVLPGGFSYGDYLRCGAIARFSPIMEAVARFAKAGGYVVGICNGFQILVEAGLLPGALLMNRGLRFVCEDVRLRVEHAESALTGLCRPAQELVLPIAHHEGCYWAPESELDRLESEGQVLLRYVDGQVNGSLRAIAGICNASRTVFGMMPHPERAMEREVGGPARGRNNTDGRLLLEGLCQAVAGGRG